MTLLVRHNLELARLSNKARNAIARVCMVFNVTADDIFSDSRTKRIAEARHLLFTLLHSTSKVSLTKIGEAFGRDHTSVIHALHATRRRFDNDAKFRQIVETLFPEAMRRMPKSFDSDLRYQRRKESSEGLFRKTA